ncbi:hypothetical protein HGA88_00270 [Candidatus Roizmanbacteria bacterium]|nr:hypothetical protein [Candidatus Roizmanbacteria bacterium]
MRILICVFLFLGAVRSSFAIEQYKTGKVSALIGKQTSEEFAIFGYTAPSATVYLDSLSLHIQTFADTTGYFEYKNIVLPFFYIPSDTCFYSVDTEKRASNSTCIPPFSIQKTEKIGPIVLSPSISLNQSTAYVGDEVLLSGQTIPNTLVTLSFFTQEQKLSLLSKVSSFSVVRPAFAFSLPPLQTRADNKGNFAFELPSSQANSFRLFTQTLFNNENSPTSHFLMLNIYPIWMLIVHFFMLLMGFLLSNWILLLTVGEIGFLVWWFIIRKKKLRPKYFALAIREPMELALPEHRELTRRAK